MHNHVVVDWKRLCVKCICLGDGDVMKEFFCYHGRDKKKNKIIYKRVCGLIGHQERGRFVEGQKFNLEDILMT